jgi:hypothetical protein
MPAAEPTIAQLYTKLADLEGRLGSGLPGTRTLIDTQTGPVRCIGYVLDTLLAAVEELGREAVIAYAAAELASQAAA